MIETRTTKQIVDKHSYLCSVSDEHLTSNGLEIKNMVWVGLESLKKEIEKEKKENRRNKLFLDLEPVEQGYDIALDYILGLCNSQEQGKVALNDEIVSSHCAESVSCEHNNGNLTISEPSDKSEDTGEEKSSPVQNPKDEFMKENFTNVNGCLVQNPKKCTCKKPCFRYKGEINKKRIYECVRCGGVL